MFALLSRKIITSGEFNTGMHGVKVTVIGGGVVGRTAAQEFSARGSEVHLLESSPSRLEELARDFESDRVRFPKVKVMKSTPENIAASINGSFFAVSGIYVSGTNPPKLVNMEHFRLMEKGGCAYAVDIDQGGGMEGITETSILEPFDLPAIAGTNIKCFAPPNIPSMGARTTSEALGTAILPYIREMIGKGLNEAAKKNRTIRSGINIADGKITHEGLAKTFPGQDLKTLSSVKDQENPSGIAPHASLLISI